MNFCQKEVFVRTIAASVVDTTVLVEKRKKEGSEQMEIQSRNA